jgi:quercetin dioxygenase-like cupin family protein
MRLRIVVAAVTGAVVVGIGVAFAAHAPEIDPATVPTGFFVAHNYVADVPVAPIARAVQPDGADVFVQHLSLGANQVFAWHTHPGPVVVTVRSGSLTYQDAGSNACRNRTYMAGQGFVDPGFGQVHRVIAGPSGGRDLLDVLPSARVGEPHRHNLRPGGVLVATERMG